MADIRTEQLHTWLSQFFLNKPFSMASLAGDASFRRYFRVQTDTQSYVAMDAPPDHEDTGPFVHVAELLLAQGIRAPMIVGANLEQGFLLLSDFGDALLLKQLNAGTADAYYQQCFAVLQDLAAITPDSSIAPFDVDFMLMEMQRFIDWYLEKQRGMTLTQQQRDILASSFNWLAQAISEQPYVFVHRDFHSRNLIVCEDGELGVLDFQDAVHGPITYDLVSLLRDCYINWPNEQVNAWVATYHQQLLTRQVLRAVSLPTFMRWFDCVSVQRHLKCIGIFARLALRDNKPEYLNDVPRVFAYLQHEIQRIPELAELAQFLREIQAS